MADSSPADRRLTTFIWINCITLATLVFFAGATYQRLISVEIRVTAMEAQEAQFNAIAAMQAQIHALEAEVVRARDRVDRAVDLAQPNRK